MQHSLWYNQRFKYCLSIFTIWMKNIAVSVTPDSFKEPCGLWVCECIFNFHYEIKKSFEFIDSVVILIQFNIFQFFFLLWSVDVSIKGTCYSSLVFPVPMLSIYKSFSFSIIKKRIYVRSLTFDLCSYTQLLLYLGSSD